MELQPVIFNEYVQRKDGFYVTFNSSSATPDGVFFTAYQALEIINVSEVHSVASTPFAATLDLERLQGTEAPGAGDSILKTAFDLEASVNTVDNRNGHKLTNARVLEPDDRLAIVLDGVAWLSGITVTVYFKFWGRGDYL